MTKIVEQLKFYVKNNWWKWLIIVGVIAIDLVTKALIVKLDDVGNVVSTETTLIKDVLVIYPVLNEGAGFSLLSGKTIFLIVITFIFLIALAVFDILFKKKSSLFAVATGLIFAGAIGNLIDRLMFAKVRDFIYLQFIKFPVFNVADIALTAGIICLVVYLIFYAGKKPATETNSHSSVTNKNVETLSQKIETVDAYKSDIEKAQNESGQATQQTEQINQDDVDTNSQKENEDAKDNS